MGTGFLVSPNLVITAQHVVNAIRALGLDWGDITTTFVAVNIDKPGKAQILNRRGSVVFTVGVVLPDGREVVPPAKIPMSDLAALKLQQPLHSDLAPTPQGLPIATASDVMVTEPVVIPGYFLSAEMLTATGSSHPRVGPIFFSGHVASIAPHGLRGHRLITDYHVDVTCGGGMSGAPVYTLNGDVIGVLTGGIETEAGFEGEDPSNLARVLPLSPDVMRELIAHSATPPQPGTQPHRIDAPKLPNAVSPQFQRAHPVGNLWRLCDHLVALSHFIAM